MPKIFHTTGSRIFYLCLEPVREGHASYTHVIETVEGLTKLGWTVKLFSPSYKSKNLPFLYERVLEMFKAQWRLITSKTSPNLLYIRCHPFSFFTSAWAKIKGIKMVQEVNGPYEDLFIAWPWTRYFRSFFKLLYRKQFQWADHIITVTEGLKHFLEIEAKHKRISVISNGVNTSLFNSKAKTHHKLPSQFVVFFGTFSRWHGIPLLLQAVEEPEWPQNIKLVFIGDGIERGLIENKLKNNPNIIYLGRLPYKEIGGIVAQAKAGLLPIQNIGKRASTGLSPLKLFETVACCVPVIASDQPEQTNFVAKNKVGWIVSEQTPEAWAKAVKIAVSQEHSEFEFTKSLIKSISWDEKVKNLNRILLSL